MTLSLMVDIDEVIFRLGDSIHDIGEEVGLHDGKLPWRYWEAWKQYGCAPEEYWKLWDIFVERDGYRTTPPIEGAVEALRHLYFEGHQIHLVTARGFMAHAEEVRAATVDWLEEFAVPHHTLTFSRDKAGEQEKLGAFDLAIDDSPRNYANLEEAGVNVWLQRHPHNEWFEIQRAERSAHVSGVDNLWEFAEIAARRAVA